MRVDKTTQPQRDRVDPGDLERINQLSRRPLTAEEVYTFSVRLCDSEVDRDGERFAPETLEELASLFVGKSGIFDHQWSARGQTARIYRAEVVREPERLTRAGDGYCWLKGWAYMLRTEVNAPLIDEIEAGIKKEVSVGCAVERAVCSICGKDRRTESCGHRNGALYDGKLCWTSLEGASDAYEFSFVAVPAQREAGVVKSFQPEDQACLEREAALGRKYLNCLREEMVRLALLADGELQSGTMKSLAGKLSPEELEMLTRSYARRAGERYPIRTQLQYGEKQAERSEEDQAFLV